MSGAGFFPTTDREKHQARGVKTCAMQMMIALNKAGTDCEIVIAGVLLAVCEMTAESMEVGPERAQAEVIDIVSHFQPSKAN